MPDHAGECIRAGQSAIVIFTRGPKFKFDKTTGNGYSGNWRIRRKNFDRVIIYHRSFEQPQGAEIYIGTFGGLAEAIEPATPKERKERRSVHFTNLKRDGETAVNFHEFTGNSRTAFCFVYR